MLRQKRLNIFLFFSNDKNQHSSAQTCHGCFYSHIQTRSHTTEPGCLARVKTKPHHRNPAPKSATIHNARSTVKSTVQNCVYTSPQQQTPLHRLSGCRSPVDPIASTRRQKKKSIYMPRRAHQNCCKNPPQEPNRTAAMLFCEGPKKTKKNSKTKNRMLSPPLRTSEEKTKGIYICRFHRC